MGKNKIHTKTQRNGHTITWTLQQNDTSILEFDPPMRLDNEEIWQFLNEWRRKEEDDYNERLLLGSIFK